MQPKYYGAAAEYNKPGGFQINKRLFVIIGLVFGLLMLLSIGLLVLNSISSAPRNEFARLVARHDQLHRFISDNQSSIRDAELSSINSTAALLVLSDSTALASAMRTAYGSSEIPKDIVASEADTASAPELEEALSLGRFDETYRSLLREKLAASQQLVKQVAAEARKSTQATLQQTLDSIAAIDSELAKLNP